MTPSERAAALARCDGLLCKEVRMPDDLYARALARLDTIEARLEPVMTSPRPDEAMEAVKLLRALLLKEQMGSEPPYVNEAARQSWYERHTTAKEAADAALREFVGEDHA